MSLSYFPKQMFIVTKYIIGRMIYINAQISSFIQVSLL